MPEPKSCAAYQCSDQMVCDRCEIIWDMNDDDPPQCDPALKPTQIILTPAPINQPPVVEPPGFFAGLRALLTKEKE